MSPREEKTNSTVNGNGNSDKKDLKIRLDSDFVDKLDVLAKKLNLSRNAVIGLMLSEGVTYSPIANNKSNCSFPD